MSAVVILGGQAAWLPLDANPITQPGRWLVDGLVAYIQSLDPGQAFAAIAVSIVPTVARGENPWEVAGRSTAVRLGTTCGMPGALPIGCELQRVRGELQQIGRVVLAVVLVARLAGLGARGQFRSPHHVLFDIFPRIVIGAVSIQLVGPALTAAIRLATGAALIVSSLVLSTAEGATPQTMLAHVATAAGLVAITPVLYATIGFLFFLLQVVNMGLVLLGLVAPALIALALHGEHGRIATAWFRAVTSCLLVMVVAQVGVAASIALLYLFTSFPVAGIQSGPLAGEAGLLATSIACVVLAKSAFQHTRHGFRVTFEGVHLDGVTNLPGQVMSEVRRGIDLAVNTGMGAARMAAGDPSGAVQVGMAASRHFRSRTPPSWEDREERDFGTGRSGRAGVDPGDGGDGGGPGASVLGGQDPLSSPTFLAYCAVQVDVERRGAGPFSRLADLAEGGEDRARASVNERHRLYARFLADRPQGEAAPAAHVAARPAA